MTSSQQTPVPKATPVMDLAQAILLHLSYSKIDVFKALAAINDKSDTMNDCLVNSYTAVELAIKFNKTTRQIYNAIYSLRKNKYNITRKRNGYYILIPPESEQENIQKGLNERAEELR